MPRALVDKSHGWFRAWFRKVWKLRGGGLYACGFAVTFVVLEIQSLADDVLGLGSIFNGQAIDFIVQFFVDSWSNTISAFMWPISILQFAPPYGAIALGLAFFGFTSILKKPIENWMFSDMPDEDESNP